MSKTIEEVVLRGKSIFTGGGPLAGIDISLIISIVMALIELFLKFYGPKTPAALKGLAKDLLNPRWYQFGLRWARWQLTGQLLNHVNQQDILIDVNASIEQTLFEIMADKLNGATDVEFKTMQRDVLA